MMALTPTLWLWIALTGAFNPPSPASISTYAPLPSTAIGPPVSNETGFRVEELGVGAYLLTDGLYQSLFFVACDSVLVVDAPPTIGMNVLKGIQSVTDLPVTHVVYSHSHADHIGAAYLLDGPNVTFIAHEDTATELSFAPNDTTRPMPSTTFRDDLEIRVCNQTLQLSYKGLNHDPGNIFIYAPIQKIIMLVDIVYPGWVPFDKLGESQSVPGYIKAHEQILEYDFDYYIGGHLNRYGVRQDVIIQQEYINDLYDNCLEAILLGAAPPNDTNPISVQTALSSFSQANPGNPWAIFDYYSNIVTAEYCSNKTQEKWLGKLGGADVYTWSNAASMFESIRIDFGILGPYGVKS